METRELFRKFAAGPEFERIASRLQKEKEKILDIKLTKTIHKAKKG